MRNSYLPSLHWTLYNKTTIMATEVTVPSMGESISSGILSAWLVNDGDFVKKDQPIYELETDKITSEATAEVSGIIHFKVKQEAEVDIGSVVATIDESAVPASETAPSKTDASKTVDEASSQAMEGEEPSREPAPDPSLANDSDDEKKLSPTLKVSPLAQKIAKDQGIDLNAIHGSGPGGRIVKSDLERQNSDAKASGEKTDSDRVVTQAQVLKTEIREARETRIKMSPLRKKIAQRLVQATQQAALLTTFNEVDMTRVMELRKKHQSDFVEKYGIKLGFMSFFTKAVVAALKSVPTVNARIEGEHIIQQNYYDIGVAVGTDKGLMVPVIRDCDQKNFSEIEATIAAYAADARNGKIQLGDLEGGVFTISNGGIYGSMLSTPIINFPQPAILGLHNIQQRPVVQDGAIVARPMMYLALSYDHRLIDGKEAVSFLSKIKQSIENPDRLLIGL